MIETIISNNCSGAAVMHELGMEFKTPTINLQILPEQFNFFCRSLAYYMSMDLVECSVSDLTEEHKAYLTKMFGSKFKVFESRAKRLCDELEFCKRIEGGKNGKVSGTK